HGSDLDELVGAADQALYLAKEQGRDQVVLFNPARKEPATKEEQAKKKEEQSRRRILIVDGKKSFTDASVELLHTVFHCEVVATQQDAVATCLNNQFDVLVVAEDLVDGSGTDFLQQTIAWIPDAVRILVLENTDAFITIRGTNFARVDFF